MLVRQTEGVRKPVGRWFFRSENISHRNRQIFFKDSVKRCMLLHHGMSKSKIKERNLEQTHGALLCLVCIS